MAQAQQQFHGGSGGGVVVHYGSVPYGPVFQPQPEPQQPQYQDDAQDVQDDGGAPPFFESKPLPPPEPSAADQKACAQVERNLGYAQESAQRDCRRFTRVSKALGADFGSCVDTLQRLSDGSTELNPFCFYLDRAQTSPRTLQCIVDSLKVVKSGFWYLEDESAERQTQGEQIPFMMRTLLHECAHPATMPEAHNVKVVGLAAYNALQGIKGWPEGLGGLSGLTRQGDNELLSISDSKDHPVIHKFKYNVSENPTKVDVHYDGFIPLKIAGLDADFEDLALLPSGELLASTEVVTDGKKKLFGGSVAPSLLVKYDREFKNSTAVDVPEELIPQTTTREVKCEPLSPPQFYGFPPAEVKKQMAQFKADEANRKCYRTDAKGIQFNKGLEGMSFDAASNSVFFAPEQPLAQNKPEIDGFGQSPFYRAQLNGTKLASVERFVYPIDTLYDNGISAMLALDHDNVLVLERGFDQVERRARMHLYKIQLKDAGQPLKKTLVLDFDSLRSQVPAGFQLLDNFEGIALGPKLSNGHQIMFFVSDDNFSPVQKTLLMTLEVGDLQ